MWNFGSGFVRKNVILGVDNTSSSHTDNQKNNFSVLGEVLTQGIDDSIGKTENNSINFSKAKTKFCLSFY